MVKLISDLIPGRDMRSSRSSVSGSSRISVNKIQLIIEKLKSLKNRETTKYNYLSIWRHFNRFISNLDRVPKTWEQRTVLFIAHLTDQGLQSSTIKSYISAIKCVLKDDDYEWDENQSLLSTLTRACKMVNDRVHIRRPIRRPLLEVILFEVGRLYNGQPYLVIMYRALFALLYYGLFRIGELTKGDHPVKAADVHVAKNKQKMLFVLRSSKTHGKSARLQKVKVQSMTHLVQVKGSGAWPCAGLSLLKV